MKKVWIGLGTNIEPRQEHIQQALELLAKNSCITIRKQSSIYETAPVGYTDQADFLNMVLEIESSLSAEALLNFCQKIELQLGRKRTIRFGPRTIDLDILIYNNENIKTERLIIPHPRMHERAFVLVPLSEIANELLLEKQNKRVGDLIAELPDAHDVKKWSSE